MRSKNYQLQFITHYNHRFNYVDSARIALEGGCRWVQLRMKGVDEAILEQNAIVIQQMCREYGATFIIDDNVALAKRIRADGVHLGKGDMPICEARKILGDEYIIGGTVNSFDDILCAMEHSAPDYFGCGPYRYTSTKQNLAPILGINGYNEIIRKMRVRGIDIPLVAIGGIGREDIPHILECGVHGIALSGSVLNADDPTCEMQRIVKMFDRE
jgi:thiamine-phosphate pyrophosphorylase